MLGTSQVLQHITLRGIPEEKLKKPLEQAKGQKELPAYRCDTVANMLEMYLSYSTHATVSNVTTVRKPLSVNNPFPKIFNKDVGIHGEVYENDLSEMSKFFFSKKNSILIVI